MSYNFNFTESGYSPTSYDFNFGGSGDATIYNILKASSNNFSAVFVCNNKLCIGSNGAVNVIDLDTNSLCDYYSETHKGRSGELLNAADIVDLVAI